MKRDRMMPFRKSSKRDTCHAVLTDDQLDALARAHGSRLIRQPGAPAAAPQRNASLKGKIS